MWCKNLSKNIEVNDYSIVNQESENQNELIDIENLNILNDFPEMKNRSLISLEIILLVSFSVLAFILGMIYLNDYITPGMDGGYYELLTSYFLTNGKLYYQSPILLFLFTAFFTIISGGDTTFGVTFTASLLFAAGVVTNYFAAKITWNRKVAFFTLPFSALSSILFSMSTNFMKNLLAMVFIPIALASFSRFHLKREWKYFGLSIGFAALTMGSHLYTALALSVCLVGYFVIYHIITSLEEKKIDWKNLMFSVILLLSIALGMGIVWVINEYAVPVLDTYWGYSSNILPSVDNDNYTPSDTSGIYSLTAIFQFLPRFETILMILFAIFMIGNLAGKASKKERQGIILLIAMLVPLWLLAISVDIDGWIQRFSQDLASFLILSSAFTVSNIVVLIEKVAHYIVDSRFKIKISKLKPKISFSLVIIGLLVVPLIFQNISTGKTLSPIITSNEVEDLQTIEGQLPEDSLLYGKHGLEYWASFYTGYECRKISESYQQPSEMFELLNSSDYKSYLLWYKADRNIMYIENTTASTYTTDYMFSSVFTGNIFVILSANPNYSSPTEAIEDLQQPPPVDDNGPQRPDDGKTNYNVLTFPLMIQFSFLSSYLHCYFVIPLTVIYWTLLIFGSYRLVRLAYNQIKKPTSELKI